MDPHDGWYTNQTTKKLAEFAGNTNLRFFGLDNIPDTFNANEFVEFMKVSLIISEKTYSYGSNPKDDEFELTCMFGICG